MVAKIDRDNILTARVEHPDDLVDVVDAIYDKAGERPDPTRWLYFPYHLRFKVVANTDEQAEQALTEMMERHHRTTNILSAVWHLSIIGLSGIAGYMAGQAWQYESPQLEGFSGLCALLGGMLSAIRPPFRLAIANRLYNTFTYASARCSVKAVEPEKEQARMSLARAFFAFVL